MLEHPIVTGIKALAIGQYFPLAGYNNALGNVKRHSRYDYVLNDAANRERNRWGTLEQILEDVEFFVNNGTLPPPDMPRW